MKLITFLFIILSLPSIAQRLEEGQKMWSKNEPLVVDDFKMKINDDQNDALYSQFSIRFEVGGLSFLSKNLNQKIKNIFMGEASWINEGVILEKERQLSFQQLQFNLCEIHTRQFRKEALINKMKVLKGFDYLTKLNDKIISEFAKEKALLMKETRSGRDLEKVSVWEDNIQIRLDSLKGFSYDNKKRIKLEES